MFFFFINSPPFVFIINALNFKVKIKKFTKSTKNIDKVYVV